MNDGEVVVCECVSCRIPFPVIYPWDYLTGAARRKREAWFEERQRDYVHRLEIERTWTLWEEVLDAERLATRAQRKAKEARL